ncbi:hypothetical protein ACWEQL_27995 [Kitasatospora sp. NPDC004240]
MLSRTPGVRRAPAAVAGFVIAVALALTGCEPTPADTPVTPPAPAVVTTPAAVPAPATTPPPAPPVTSPPAPPAPAPTTAAPAAPAAPPSAKAPTTPKATPSERPAPTAAPVPAGDCEIRSEAGNCYKAGQYCRKADLGRSTHDATGRLLTCRIVSGQPHWQAD